MICCNRPQNVNLFSVKPKAVLSFEIFEFGMLGLTMVRLKCWNIKNINILGIFSERTYCKQLKRNVVYIPITTVKPVLVATSMKRATCIKCMYFFHENGNYI